MTEDQIRDLEPAFVAFLEPFRPCTTDPRTFDHVHTYCRSLLSDLPRKSVEPIALATHTAVRTLQLFLTTHAWQRLLLRELLQKHIAALLPTLPDDGLGTVGLLDDTAVVKKGTKTPGVQRQWCGAVGKVENCVVTVHLGVCRGTYKTLLDTALFLPAAWAADRERCRAAGIPDGLSYRPKWRIALRQLRRAQAHGVHLDWLVFDEGYGQTPFLLALDGPEGVRFVGEVKCSFACRAVRPRLRPPEGYRGQRAERLARHSPVFTQQRWRRVHLRTQTGPDQVWAAKAARVWLTRRGELSERQFWLVVARNVATGEVKYFVSNAGPHTSLRRLLRVAFRRWHVEHNFRVAKTELGFGHYEGRTYEGLLRHQTLCLVALAFVAAATERLRGEKPGGDVGASGAGAERGVPLVAGGVVGAGVVGTHGLAPPVSPAPQPRGANRAPKETTAKRTAEALAL